MMDRGEIEQKVKEIIALQFGVRIDELEDDTKFETDLNADSLDNVELIMALEDRFNLSGIPDEDVEKLFNIRLVIDYVEKILGEQDK